MTRVFLVQHPLLRGEMHMRKSLLDAAALGSVIVFTASPAWAGLPIPAPVAGVGIGALAVLAAGYVALRRRIDR
jgi:hypothetical protein